jgi:hypothetical protein
MTTLAANGALYLPQMVSAIRRVGCTPTTIMDMLLGAGGGACRLAAEGSCRAAFQSFWTNIFQLRGSRGGQAPCCNMWNSTWYGQHDDCSSRGYLKKKILKYLVLGKSTNRHLIISAKLLHANSQVRGNGRGWVCRHLFRQRRQLRYRL